MVFTDVLSTGKPRTGNHFSWNVLAGIINSLAFIVLKKVGSKIYITLAKKPGWKNKGELK